MTCPKCKASRSHLQCLTEHLEAGVVLSTVRCVACGYRDSRILGRKAAHAQRPDDRTLPDGNRSLGGHAPTYLCSVIGCIKRHQGLPGNLPMCTKHRNQQYKWETGRRRTPPPFIETGDRYLENPARKVIPRPGRRKPAPQRRAAP